MKKKRHIWAWRILLGLLAALLLMLFVFLRFGGFGTGESADPGEFAEYAERVEALAVPENARIIALGEATHGNMEFQQLKLDVFRQLVETHGVRAFALEGDYGGCEQVNRYIHGGEGTAKQAAQAIGFQIYRTREMVQLIDFMRQYNENAAEGEDLRFYGFDLQRPVNNYTLLKTACEANGVETEKLESLVSDGEWNKEAVPECSEILLRVRKELETKENTEAAVHAADMLLQYQELWHAQNTGTASDLRDQFMAENVQWIFQQEQALGHDRIFIAGHNTHVAKWGSYNSMGKLLANKYANGYYAIGTDFYKTKCSLPTASGKRTNQVFYSHDPLAKAAKIAGFETCWLDFAKVPKDSELGRQIEEYSYLGNLGEQYRLLMRLLPPSYRMFQPPAQLYDSMIFVTEANPIRVQPEQ